MNKKKRHLCIGFLLIGFIILFSSLAEARTKNGLTITDFTGNNPGQNVIFFSDFNPAGTNTFFYNNDSGTSTTSGSLITRHAVLVRNLQYYIPQLGSDAVVIRVESEIGTTTVWNDILTIEVTGTMTIAKPINILESPDFVRVGVSGSGTAGTDLVNISGKFQ
jgi:hypothetical protein